MRFPESEATAKKLLNIMAGHEFRITYVESDRFSFTKPSDPEFEMVVLLDDKDKYRICGTWPHTPDWGSFVPNGELPEIKVSRNKADTVVRRDIERRFLADYIPKLAEQVARKQQHLQDETNKAATIREFSRLLNAEGDTTHPHRHGVKELNVNHNGTTVRISTFSLQYDVARQVLELLKKIQPEKS